MATSSPTSGKKEAAAQDIPALPFANDGSFMEQFMKMQQQQQQEQNADEDKEGKTVGEGGEPASGAPNASINASGLQDTTGSSSGAPACAPAAAKPGASAKPPLILKSKPIIKIQKRTGSSSEQPATKKKKAEDGDDNGKSFYQKEMERYRAKNCGSDTAHDRPLVK